MNENTRYLLIAGAVVYLLYQAKHSHSSIAGADQSDKAKTGLGSSHEIPQWGANWISNQWAVVMQGTAATTGQIQPGWKIY